MVLNPSTNLVTATISVAGAFESAYDTSNKLLYVTEVYNGAVAIVNPSTNTLVGSFSAGSDPAGITYDAADKDVYVLNSGSNNVTIFSPGAGKVIANVALNTSLPYGIAYDPATHDVDAVGQSSTNFFVLSSVTHTEIGNASLGGNGWQIAYDPADQDMVMSTNFGPALWINAASQVVASSVIGSDLNQFAYDSASHTMFADDYFNGPIVQMGS